MMHNPAFEPSACQRCCRVPSRSPYKHASAGTSRTQPRPRSMPMRFWNHLSCANP